MKSVCLLPYCPLPTNSGARAVFRKHMDFLRSQGECTIVSAKNLPVGGGWLPQYEKDCRDSDFRLIFRDPRRTVSQWFGIAYAAFFKILRMERAFGHSNPYHRYAFPADWWYSCTKSADIAEIHYSYWARLPSACPKVVVVHDLWLDIMWEGGKREISELQSADLVVTVSATDRDKLIKNGLKNVHREYSPENIASTYIRFIKSVL